MLKLRSTAPSELVSELNKFLTHLILDSLYIRRVLKPKLMKKMHLLLLVLLLLGKINAQEKTSEDDLTQYLNKKVEYCDQVFGTFVSKGTKKVILLNLGANYPNHRLVVAIFEGDWHNFPYQPAEYLKNKEICVKGKLILYKGKPEIIVKSPDQITVKP